MVPTSAVTVAFPSMRASVVGPYELPPARTPAPALASTAVWYHGTNMKIVERIQTGVRIERRTLKVLKALAAHLEIGLGDLLEGVVLHAFEGKTAFSLATLAKIK